MMHPEYPVPENEEERLRALKAYGIMDTLPEEQFENFTKLAAAICKTPIALIGFIDEHRQWYKSRIGLEGDEVPREVSFCRYAIASDADIYEVQDTTKDPLFADSPFVTGDPNVRFYAGRPLVTHEGYKLGTLCVIDRVPRTLTNEQREALKILGSFVIEQLELRKSKLELEESRQLYEDMVNGAGDIIYTTDAYGIFTFFNKSIEPILGYKATELVGQHFGDIIVPEWREQIQEFYMHQFQEQIPETILEFPVLAKDGHEVWVEQTVVLQRNKDRNRVKGFQSVVRNINARKYAEAELARANQLIESTNKTLQGIIDNTTSIIIKKDLEGRILMLNQPYAKMLGKTSDELLNTFDADNFPEPLASQIRKEDHRVIETGQAIESMHNVDLSDGTHVYLTNKFPLLDSEDQIYATGSISIDITEQKKIEKALNESNTKFFTTFSSSPIAMLINSVKSNKIVNVNQAFENMFGYSVEDSMGQDVTRIGLISDDESLSIQHSLINRGRIQNYEINFKSKEGKTGVALLSIEAMQIDGEPHFLSILYDITERKKMEEELVKAKELAEQSSIAKEQFLTNMSHEIRTPMNAVLGFTELLSRTRLTPEQHRYIRAIETSGKNLMGIINNILDYSKIEAGMMVLEDTELNVHTLAESISVIFKDRAKEKNVKLRVQVAKEVPTQLIGDPMRLSQILTNLVSNAMKFTSEGSIRLMVDLEHQEPERVQLKFTVIDSGIGIAEDKLDGIFERFNQASNDTTRKYGGTGLGLSIVKRLVELSNGSIQVTSKPGKGTTFMVILPYRIDKTNREVIPIMSKPAKDKNKRPTKLSVLLVEDNLLNQKLAERVLLDFRFHVDIAGNGVEAVEKLKHHHYDVVLMDIQMPEMDGYEATQVIRQELNNAVPIIAMTAHAITREKDKCLRLGMNDYISKPFKADDLREKIMRQVEYKIMPGKAPTTLSKPSSARPVLIKVDSLEHYSKGNRKFVAEMLDVFIHQIPIELKNIQKAITNRDFATIRTTANKLKSSVTMMGLNKELGPLLQEMEEKARQEKDMRRLLSLYTKVDASFQVAVKQARRIRRGYIKT